MVNYLVSRDILGYVTCPILKWGIPQEDRLGPLGYVAVTWDVPTYPLSDKAEKKLGTTKDILGYHVLSSTYGQACCLQYSNPSQRSCKMILE